MTPAIALLCFPGCLGSQASRVVSPAALRDDTKSTNHLNNMKRLLKQGFVLIRTHLTWESKLFF